MSAARIIGLLSCIVIIGIVATPEADAQSFNLPPSHLTDTTTTWTLGIGAGTSANLTRWGAFGPSVSVEVGYAIDDDWFLGASPSFDREYSDENGVLVPDDDWSIALGGGYAFTEHLTFAGATWFASNAWGIACSPNYSWRWTKSTYMSVGATGGYSITDSEFDLSMEFSIGIML